jgi:hypothetical protein
VSDDQTDALAVPMRVLSGNPTTEEVAAVTAVVTAALEELADQNARIESGPSAWQQSQRNIRATLRPGAGAWRGFAG